MASDTPPLHAQLATILEQHGWKGSGDTPTLALREALPTLQALLAPRAIPPGGPAFPVDQASAIALALEQCRHLEGTPGYEAAYLLARAQACAGMGLLDAFAMAAMQGLLAEPKWREGQQSVVYMLGARSDDEAQNYSNAAYMLGAAMLKAREKYL